jgi:hypothetical protein
MHAMGEGGVPEWSAEAKRSGHRAHIRQVTAHATAHAAAAHANAHTATGHGAAHHQLLPHELLLHQCHLLHSLRGVHAASAHSSTHGGGADGVTSVTGVRRRDGGGGS